MIRWFLYGFIAVFGSLSSAELLINLSGGF